MIIARQGSRFVAVGVGLVIIDWLVFVVLTLSGLATIPSNVCSRAVGALLGFWANGHVTFGEPDQPRLGLRRFVRYAAAWITMTFLSTLLVALVADRLTLELAWLAKPLVEAGLAVVSFFVSRHWVYR
ncbi:MAG TPA: GtrA family protein [Rhodanobacteraceae bacterium]